MTKAKEAFMQSGLLTESGRNRNIKEGELTKSIEKQTAKVPSTLFLAAAGGAVALSLGLAMSNRKQWANFIGQWVPTILLLGIYNKIVKTQGSDQQEHYLH